MIICKHHKEVRCPYYVEGEKWCKNFFDRKGMQPDTNGVGICQISDEWTDTERHYVWMKLNANKKS